jgi:hypothetical protein
MAALWRKLPRSSGRLSPTTALSRNWAVAGWAWCTRPRTSSYSVMLHSLPQGGAVDSTALRRFEREARAASGFARVLRRPIETARQTRHLDLNYAPCFTIFSANRERNRLIATVSPGYRRFRQHRSGWIAKRLIRLHLDALDKWDCRLEDLRCRRHNGPG